MMCKKCAVDGVEHPDNDLTIMNCSRCDCPPEKHEEIKHETAREQGNDAFAIGRWDDAVLHYTRGIELFAVDSKLWSNRSASYAAKGWCVLVFLCVC